MGRTRNRAKALGISETSTLTRRRRKRSSARDESCESSAARATRASEASPSLASFAQQATTRESATQGTPPLNTMDGVPDSGPSKTRVDEDEVATLRLPICARTQGRIRGLRGGDRKSDGRSERYGVNRIETLLSEKERIERSAGCPSSRVVCRSRRDASFAIVRASRKVRRRRDRSGGQGPIRG